MMRQLAVGVAAVALLAGCSGGGTSDSKTDSTDSSATTSSAPAIKSFDPPKTFAAVSAFPKERTEKNNQYTIQPGLVGQTSLLATLDGVTGRNIAGRGSAWNVPSQAAPTAETSDLTKPMAVQLNGKEVIAMAYVQRDGGNGTQKAKGQVLFQWIDPAQGKKVAEVVVDLTPVLGPGEGGDDVLSQAYDAATGQIAIGVSPGSEAAAKKADGLTVYADPRTRKSTVVPSVIPAGLLNGVIAGAKGRNQEQAADGTIVLVDAASGKITKQTPTGMDYLHFAGAGVKHAYLSGSRYVAAKSGEIFGSYASILYSVDIASGAVVQTKAASVDANDPIDFTCLSDGAKAAVCTGGSGNDNLELAGMDDTTGKKAWGYTSKAANRVVPEVTAAFHGVVYAQTDTQPVLLDAATGDDLPGVGATSGGASSPSGGTDPGSANGSDMSQFDGTAQSPTVVSRYGGAYLQHPAGSTVGIETILVVLRATA